MHRHINGSHFFLTGVDIPVFSMWRAGVFSTGQQPATVLHVSLVMDWWKTHQSVHDDVSATVGTPVLFSGGTDRGCVSVEQYTRRISRTTGGTGRTEHQPALGQKPSVGNKDDNKNAGGFEWK